jgi:uncharacterized protein (TIGR00369 family)
VNLLDDLNHTMAQAPLHQWLRCYVQTHDPASGEVKVILPARQELRRSPDEQSVHGGIVATLVDLAAHAAINVVTGTGMPTIDLRVDYLRVAIAPLTAVAKTRRVGRSVGVADVDVFDRDEHLVALGRVVYRTLRV